VSDFIEETNASSNTKHNVDTKDDEIISQPPDSSEVTQKIKISHSENFDEERKSGGENNEESSSESDKSSKCLLSWAVFYAQQEYCRDPRYW